METFKMYFCLSDLPLKKEYKNALRSYLHGKVEYKKEIRHLVIGGSPYSRAHKREIKCNCYNTDQVIHALQNLKTKQRMLLESAPILLSYLLGQSRT